MVTPDEVRNHMDEVWGRLMNSWREYKDLAAKREYTEATRKYGTYADHMDATSRLLDIKEKLKENPGNPASREWLLMPAAALVIGLLILRRRMAAR